MIEETIFPFLDENEVPELEENILQTAKEWAWNFDKNEFDLKNNKMYIVERNEAIKIWIYKILKTERFKYLIYDHDYGHEMNNFIGDTGTQAYIKSEIKRMVEEALYTSLESYITNIYNFKIEIESDEVNIQFIVNTIYDDEEVLDIEFSI